MTATGTPARTSRRTWYAVAVVLAIVVLGAVLKVGDDGRGGVADPDNPEPEGARAVARVLGKHGVDVRVVRGQAAYLKAEVSGATVVVSNAGDLGPSTYRRLARHARDAGDLVLVDPAPSVEYALGLPDRGDEVGFAQAGCSDDRYSDLTVEVPAVPGFRASGCFGDDDGRLLVPAPARARTELLASPSVLLNQTVLDADNAALALRLLGQSPRLVWYVADPRDTTAADAVSVGAFVPPWVVPGLWVLAAAVVAGLLWRGRRLGPLVAEPMPVVVRAAESTESRGRLYRRTHDREHAARTLRAATRARLARALSTPAPDASEAAIAGLVLAVARTTGRSPDEVGALIADRPVSTDAALTDLGRGLIQLENEVRGP